MCNSVSRIVVALIILLPIAFSQYLDSTIIETALSSVWTPVSSKFDRPATCSIVGHDYVNDRIVIFGGINKNNSTGYDMNLYVYDMIQDKLFTISNALYSYYNHWDSGRKMTVIYNCGSTNAVIYYNSMYFVDNNGVSKLNLNPFYRYIVDSVNQSSVPAILDYMETMDIHGRKYYPRFPVANGCIFMNHLLLYVFYTDQTYIQYSQKVFVFGSNWAVPNQFVQYDIFAPFRAGKAFFGADYSCGHIPCSCVAVDDTLYVIGGKKDRLTTMDLTEIPHLDLNDSYYYPFNASDFYRLSNISSIGCSVIKDDTERYIYLLGGMNNSRQILKIDTLNINLSSLLNITLSSDIKYSTIISSNENNRIYAFRGLDGNSDQGAFIDISSTLAITQIPNSDAGNQSILGPTMEFIFGILFIGFICICGAFLIYRWALKRYPQQSSQENLVEKDASEAVDKLEMINHNKIEEDSDEKQEIELMSHEKTNWSNGIPLTEEKLQELYCTYLKSRFNCFHQCEQIGLTHQYIQQLFERFEQINTDCKT